MAKAEFDYTKAMAELEQIAAKVESLDTSLDDIGALVRKSKDLVTQCREYLRTVRESVNEE